MSYNKVEQVNRDIAGTITGLFFDVGRPEEINIHSSIASKPLCWMVPRPYTASPISNNNRLYDIHEVELFFFKQGKMSNDNTENFQLIKDCDEIAKEFSITMKDFAESNEIDVRDFRFQPIYFNAAKNLFCGVLLTYTLEMADDFNYCS